MEDLIKRSDATEMVYKALRTPPLKGALTDTMSLAVALVQDIPSADRPQEWIPCSERLPSGDAQVIVNVCVDDAPWNIILMQAQSVKEYYKRGHINAWMPLPKPWEGADDE